MTNKSYRCFFCGVSFFSNEKRLSHEKICDKNNTITDKEKFENKIKFKSKNSQNKP